MHFSFNSLGHVHFHKTDPGALFLAYMGGKFAHAFRNSKTGQGSRVCFVFFYEAVKFFKANGNKGIRPLYQLAGLERVVFLVDVIAFWIAQRECCFVCGHILYPTSIIRNNAKSVHHSIVIVINVEGSVGD